MGDNKEYPIKGPEAECLDQWELELAGTGFGVDFDYKRTAVRRAM